MRSNFLILFFIYNFAYGVGEFYNFYSDHPKKELYNEIREHYPDFSLPQRILEWEDDKGYKMLPDGYMQMIPVGPMQMWAMALPGKKFLTIYQVKAGGVASKLKLLPWDEIHEINGKPFTVAHTKGKQVGEDGPIKELGEALDIAQSKGGLVLTIKRKLYSDPKRGAKKSKVVSRKVVVRVEKIGRFSPTYPAHCRKSAMLRKELAEIIYSKSKKKRVSNGLSHALVGLALLSYGDPAMLDGVEDYMSLVLNKADPTPGNSDIRVSEARIKNSWVNGFSLIFLAEYFWATGDEHVFATLQKLAYSAGDDHQNPFGGSGHSIGGVGSYTDITFGPPGALNILGMALAEKVGCKVNKAAYQKYYDSMSQKVVRECQVAFSKHTKNPKSRLARAGANVKELDLKIDPNRFYSVGYMAKVRSSTKSSLGESAFNTAAAALALQHAPAMGDSKKLRAKLIEILNLNPHCFSYIHATPSLGMFWCSLAVSSAEPMASKKRTNPKGKVKLGNQSHMNYRKFWLTMARSPEKDWFYFYPKQARMSPLGGGWGGDGYLKLAAASLYQPLIMLTSDKRNLLMQGNRHRNWLNPNKNPKETYAFIKKYHEFYATELLKKAIQLQKERKYLEAYHVYDRLMQNYSDLKSMRSLKARYSAFVKKLGKKNLAFKLQEEEGQKYLDYVDIRHERVGKLNPEFRQSLIYYVAEKFKGHPIAKKALAQAEIDVSVPDEKEGY